MSLFIRQHVCSSNQNEQSSSSPKRTKPNKTILTVTQNLPLRTGSLKPLQEKCKPGLNLKKHRMGCRKKGTSVFTSLSGSMTAEAAICCVLFLLAVQQLMFFLILYRTEAVLQFETEQIVRETSIEKLPQTAAVRVQNALQQAWQEEAGGITLSGGRLSAVRIPAEAEGLSGTEAEDLLDIGVVFQASPAGSLISPLKGTYILRSRRRLWTGKNSLSDAEENSQDAQDARMVYVTEHESVYHVSAECTHLKLSVTGVTVSSLGERRNADGARYQPCEKCIGKKEPGAVVYIAPEGDCYHSDRSCSGLTRHVRVIPESEAEEKGLSACSRCGGGT